MEKVLCFFNIAFRALKEDMSLLCEDLVEIRGLLRYKNRPVLPTPSGLRYLSAE